MKNDYLVVKSDGYQLICDGSVEWEVLDVTDLNTKIVKTSELCTWRHAIRHGASLIFFREIMVVDMKPPRDPYRNHRNVPHA